MGNQVSSSHCVNLEFLEDEKRENFLQTLGQCSKEDRVKISKEILTRRTDIKNFVFMTKGPLTTPRLWHSENIFVCAITTPNPPIELGYVAYHQYHSLPFMSIHVDPISYAYHVYFMNRVRFYLEPREFLEDAILYCYENQDPEALKFTFPPTTAPITTAPSLKIIVPYDIELGETADAAMNKSTALLRSIDSSSIAPAMSEPSSVNGMSSSSSFLPGTSEPGSMNSQFTSSSFQPGISEPNSMADTSSSFMNAVSEPSTMRNSDYMSSLSSVLNPISEPSGLSSGFSSGRSSFFGQISEPSGMSNSSFTSGRSSNFGLVSEPSGSSLTSQFGLVSEPSMGSSSFFGLVSEPSTGASSSQFGIVSEPSSEFMSANEGKGKRQVRDRNIKLLSEGSTNSHSTSRSKRSNAESGRRQAPSSKSKSSRNDDRDYRRQRPNDKEEILSEYSNSSRKSHSSSNSRSRRDESDSLSPKSSSSRHSTHSNSRRSATSSNSRRSRNY